MPLMNGCELAESAAELQPHLRVLYMSGYPGVILNPETPFLPKPFTPEALARKVREALA